MEDRSLFEFSEKEKKDILKRFMQEFFPYKEMKLNKIFTKEMRNDYQAQADHICKMFNMKTIYEWRSKDSAPFHITYAEGHRPENEPFARIIKNIYE